MILTNMFLLCSFGVIPTTPLPVHTPLMPNQNIDISLPLNTIGPVMKMDPLNNLQVENRHRLYLFKVFIVIQYLTKRSSSFFSQLHRIM